MRFIIDKYGSIIGAFEIKCHRHVTGAHLSGLRSFRSEYPDVPLHVIALVDHAYRINDVLVVFWKTYFQELLHQYM